MKKMRKGFTLVELLIVVAILGVLSAAMTINMSGATAKAKAAAIKANLDTCKTAAMTYYASHINETALVSSTTADAVLALTVPGWVANTGLTKGVAKYTATGSGAVNWTITATYTGDVSQTEIDTLLTGDGITVSTSGACTMNLIDELQTTTTKKDDDENKGS